MEETQKIEESLERENRFFTKIVETYGTAYPLAGPEEDDE